MIRWLPILLFSWILIPVTPAMAAKQDIPAQLDEALKSVVTFEYGQDAKPLTRVEQLVVEAAKDLKLRDTVERKLLEALSSSSTRDAKIFLCRQLRTIGTERSVPQLEKLLINKDLSHIARYALGSIEHPAAAAALHRALKKTSGKLQVGIINTLANRRYLPALSDMAKLLHSPDLGVAQAAARALGRIGNTQAAKTLKTARLTAPKALRHHIDTALLVCAEQLRAEGQTTEASRIYERFYTPDEPVHLRLAGLRGLILVRGDNATSLLVEAIKDPDPSFQRAAICFMPMVTGKEATGVFAKMLPSLPAETQELVLRALGERGDSTAAQAVSNAIKSPHEAVRIAALEALGLMGDASVVPTLIRSAATTEGREKQIARASLKHLKTDGVDAALIRSIDSSGSKMRVEIIHALADRAVTQAKHTLLKAAKDDDKSVRYEAIRALGELAGESELNTLVTLAVHPKHAQDRPAIEQAIASVFKRVSDKDSQVKPVLAALATAPPQAKPTLLRLLGRPATVKALEAIISALADSEAEVRETAVRILSQWPNPAPAEYLLTIAHNSSSRTEKVLALRGYVRMAGMSKNPTAMYVRAMELAERPEDKKLVLAGLGRADSLQALELVEQYLKDQQLQAEAALAVIQIAGRLQQNDTARAKSALRNVVAVVNDSRIKQRAQDVINKMEQYENHILVWLTAGPYTLKGKESRSVFDMAFPPEKNDPDVKWQPLEQGIGSWDINLEATFGGKDHCAAYMRTRIWSPIQQDVRLEMGSDDSIKAWLNGKLIHSNYTNRGLSPRQDLVNTKLQKGWNELLLKVVDNEGGWAFCCRLRKPDGSVLEALKIEAK